MKAQDKAKMDKESELTGQAEVRSTRVQRIADLKAAIAEGRYQVDALAVSQAIVRKSIRPKS